MPNGVRVTVILRLQVRDRGRTRRVRDEHGLEIRIGNVELRSPRLATYDTKRPSYAKKNERGPYEK